jgi:hypothetical protein
VNLAPGQRIAFQLPAELEGYMRDGRIDFFNGPIVEIGRDRYRRRIDLLIDGDLAGHFELEFGCHCRWYRRLWCKLWNFPVPMADPRIELPGL